MGVIGLEETSVLSGSIHLKKKRAVEENMARKVIKKTQIKSARWV